jgi:hypothetical protein
MAGEHELAKQIIADGIEQARANNAMDEAAFTRALMFQLLEHNRESRTDDDVISELEHYIRDIEDGDSTVVSRGC